MSKRTPGFERRPRDFYPTPAAAVVPLLPHLKAARLRRFTEPCCGDGALVRHLEAAGLICAYAGDIATGQDALEIPRFDSSVITNTPYARGIMHALIRHFLMAAPFSWLLLEADWIWTKQARPFLPHCSDVVGVGRLRWIAGSPFTSLDNFAWLRFTAEHKAGPVLHAAGSAPGRAMACESCGRSFLPQRASARFCSDTCRQRAHRALSVTIA